jgi:NAD(P)-dependent dehydrogenase (short-subunit alcohol dehydrogenase family)
MFLRHSFLRAATFSTAAAPARLGNRVAIVVGAGQQEGGTLGNGRATALAFARHGAKVMCVDIDGDSARETAEIIVSEGGLAAHCQANVTQQADCANAVKECLGAFGGVDILHNNVGIATGDGTSCEVEYSQYLRIMDVNLHGMLLMCREVLPTFREQESGSIINVSSVGSVLTLPSGGGGGIAYKLSKAGVNSLTQNLAIENAKYGVRVNAILPGLMDTPMSIERRAQEMVANEGNSLLRHPANLKRPVNLPVTSLCRGIPGLALEDAREMVNVVRNKQVPLHVNGNPKMGT